MPKNKISCALGSEEVKKSDFDYLLVCLFEKRKWIQFAGFQLLSGKTSERQGLLDKPDSKSVGAEHLVLLSLLPSLPAIYHEIQEAGHICKKYLGLDNSMATDEPCNNICISLLRFCHI